MKNFFSLKNRTALVTGSTRGIGRAILLALAEAGADVIAHGIHAGDNSQSVLTEAGALGVNAHFFPGDLSQPNGGRDFASRVLQNVQYVDIVVLNASVQIRKPWTEIDCTESAQQWQANFQSSLEIMQALMPAMCQRRWGRVLTIGSVQQVKPHPEMAVYAATKMAQFNLVRNLAGQVAQDGVTINNLSPGVILTDRNITPLANPEYAEQLLSKIPLHRFGQPEDCAGAALLLCSEAGGYITGQDFSVDGGLSL